MNRRDIDGERKRLCFEIADKSYVEQVRKLQRLYKRDKAKFQAMLLQGYTISHLFEKEEL